MSYYFADQVGYLQDAASIGGWRDFSVFALSTKSDVLHELVEKGYTERLDDLKTALAGNTPSDSTVLSTRDNMLDAARRAKGMLIVSDGVGEEDVLGDVVERMAAAVPTWKKLHAAAALGEEKFYQHMVRAFNAGRDAVSEKTIQTLLPLGHQALVEVMDRAVVAMKHELAKGLPELLLESHNRGGEVGARVINRLARKRHLRAAAEEDDPQADFAFGVESEAAKAWAAKHSGELIKGLSKTSIDNIGDAIDEILSGELTIEKAAVTSIFDAVGDLTRAKNIAAQETYNAVSNGQREAWAQGVNDGLLTKNQEKEWIVTEGLACDECQAIADNGPVPIGEDYDSDDGPVDGPPLHNRCRCTEGLVS